jgi:hypothetical protein
LVCPELGVSPHISRLCVLLFAVTYLQLGFLPVSILAQLPMASYGEWVVD